MNEYIIRDDSVQVLFQKKISSGKTEKVRRPAARLQNKKRPGTVSSVQKNGGERGIRTLAPLTQSNPLAEGPLEPLGYLSEWLPEQDSNL